MVSNLATVVASCFSHFANVTKLVGEDLIKHVWEDLTKHVGEDLTKQVGKTSRETPIDIHETQTNAVKQRTLKNEQINVENLLQGVVPNQGFELRTSGYGLVQRFRSEESFEVEQVEVIVVDQISDELICHSIQGWKLRQSEVPSTVRRTVYKSGVEWDRVYLQQNQRLYDSFQSEKDRLWLVIFNFVTIASL